MVVSLVYNLKVILKLKSVVQWSTARFPKVCTETQKWVTGEHLVSLHYTHKSAGFISLCVHVNTFCC